MVDLECLSIFETTVEANGSFAIPCRPPSMRNPLALRECLWLLCLLLNLVQVCRANEDIESVLRKVAGVFRNESAGRSRYGTSLDKTVVMTGCNYGFLNHLLNFKCFADRLNMKFLVVALDRKTHDFIRLNTTMDSIYMQYADVTEEATEFRSQQFNLITARKKEAVHDVLELGYDILFSDTDVAMVRDPFPYLLWDNVDYVHSLNCICAEKNTWDFRKSSKEEGNTGFYYVKSNERTVKLWKDAYKAVPKYAGLDDQAVFWRVIRQSVDPQIEPIGDCKDFSRNEDSEPIPLVTCVLDPCIFSSGMLSRVWVPEYTYEALLENLAIRNESFCAVHANYLKGNKPKQQRMEEYGFWLATKHNHRHMKQEKPSHENEAWVGPCKNYKMHT